MVLRANLFALVEDLALADVGEFLSKNLALSDTISEDKINHAYIGIEDCLEEDATLDALD